MYVGILCNLIVVRLNGGMPVDGDFGPYMITSMNKVYVPLEGAKLSMLGDVLIYGDTAFSAGDLLMFLGVFGTLINGMVYIFQSRRTLAT